MSIEQRILVFVSQVGWFGGQELRAIALDVRKLEDRVKQLEAKVDELHDLEKWLEGR